MTRQPAIDVGVHLPVAADAETHLKFLRFQTVFALHVPMAILTIQPGPQNMREVMKKNKVG